MNAPDRFELFLLQDGEKKIEEQPVAGVLHCSDFVIKKEDHTIGNLISEHLKMHPKVLMAGYKVSHPNVPEMFVRVQTDGSMTPKEAFVDVCKDLMRQLSKFSQEFTNEWELRMRVTDGDNHN